MNDIGSNAFDLISLYCSPLCLFCWTSSCRTLFLFSALPARLHNLFENAIEVQGLLHMASCGVLPSEASYSRCESSLPP